MKSSLIYILMLLTLTASGCSHDKTLHFAAGAAASKYVASRTQSPLAGCAAAIGVGVAKEIYDSKYGGVVDRYDALATGMGCMYTIRF